MGDTSLLNTPRTRKYLTPIRWACGTCLQQFWRGWVGNSQLRKHGIFCSGASRTDKGHLRRTRGNLRCHPCAHRKWIVHVERMQAILSNRKGTKSKSRCLTQLAQTGSLGFHDPETYLWWGTGTYGASSTGCIVNSRLSDAK